MKKRKGFTIIEFVITLLIIIVLAGVGTSVFIFAIQNLVYVPNALKMDMLAQEAIDKIVDGDNLAGGLRFCRNITAYSANSITFTDQNSKVVTFTLNNITNKLTRTIDAFADNTFLYYSSSSNINIVTGRNGALFLYYNASEGVPVTANDIRRIEINLVARTGTGAFSGWQGQEEFSSSVRTPRFL